MQSDHCKAKEVGCLEDSSPQTVAFLRSIASMLRQESSRSTARSAFKKVHCQRRATLRATVFKEELTPQLLGSGGRVLKFSALKDSVAKLPKLNKTAYSMSRVMRPTHLLVSQGSTAQRRIKLSRKHKLHWCLKVKLEVAQRSKSFEEACTQKFSI